MSVLQWDMRVHTCDGGLWRRRARSECVWLIGWLVWCCRFVCDFLDEVPDDVFYRLTPAAQVAFEPVNSTTGVKTRLRAQYYVMAMHSMSLANALTMFKVCVCACDRKPSVRFF